MFDSVGSLFAALEDVGAVLAEAGASVRVVVVGGAALMLLNDGAGVATRDIDIAAVVGTDNSLEEAGELPAALIRAIDTVATIRGLNRGWFNGAVVASFGVRLPEGAVERGTPHVFGGLTIIAVSRIDLIALKFLAATGRRPDAVERHVLDVERLRPTAEELAFAADWTRSQHVDPREFDMRIRELVERLSS